MTARPAEPVQTQTLLEVPGWNAVLKDKRVLVLEPDFEHLSAYSAKTGKRLWRLHYQDKGSGGQSLQVLGDRVVCWAGNRVHILDTARGKILRSYESVWNNNSEHCFLKTYGDLCAAQCQCELFFFDCETGKQVGKRFRRDYIEFHDMEFGSSGGCYGKGNRIWGREKDEVFFTRQIDCPEGKQKPFGRCTDMVALHVRTGKLRVLPQPRPFPEPGYPPLPCRAGLDLRKTFPLEMDRNGEDGLCLLYDLNLDRKQPGSIRLVKSNPAQNE